MKYPINAKVEFKTVGISIDTHKPRYVYYRIVPSELGFFKRVFCNPWKRMYHAFKYWSCYDFFYSPKQYNLEIAPLNTFGDVCDYLEKQHNLAKEVERKLFLKHMEAVKKGEEWE